MSNYEKWLNEEKAWIAEYCDKMRKRLLFVTTPLTLLVLAVVMGLLAMLGGSVEEAIYAAGAGAMMGVPVCGLVLLIGLPGLSPKRMVKKIRSNVKALGLSEAECEQLGKEMLEADDSHKLLFKMQGPNAKGTPAKFVATAHYVFLEGGSPYSNLVRLSDMAQIHPDEERKEAVTRGAKIKTYHYFTLYTIQFYRKDRVMRGLTNHELPDKSMGFFEESIRDKAWMILQEAAEDNHIQ